MAWGTLLRLGSHAFLNYSQKGRNRNPSMPGQEGPERFHFNSYCA